MSGISVYHRVSFYFRYFFFGFSSSANGIGPRPIWKFVHNKFELFPNQPCQISIWHLYGRNKKEKKNEAQPTKWIWF